MKPKQSDKARARSRRRATTDAEAEEVKAVFSVHLRTLRKATGRSQEAVAREASVDRTYFSQLERGVRQPTLSTLRRISRALGIPIVKLVECVDDLP